MSDRESPAVANTSLIFVCTALVLGFIFDYLFIWKMPGISVLVFTLLIAFAMTVLARLLNRKLSRDVVLLLILVLFFSAMVAVRANVLLTVLNIFGTMLLLLVVSEVNVKGSLRDFAGIDYVKICALPIQYLISLIDTLANVRLPFSKGVDNQTKQIIRGTLLTVPVILLFGALFAGADPIFHTALLSILGLFHLPSPEHPYVIVAISVVLCGALGYSFKKDSVVHRAVSVPRRPMGHIETSILLGSVNALFVLFIALQATYIFGGVTNITNDTYTFAEYARRGFFELIAISAFTYLIMVVTEKFIERDTQHHSTQFKYLSAALVLQTMVLMIFAFSRLSLYESAFGFTTLRLYSHAFIVLLAVVYVLLLYKIFIDTSENTFLLRVFFAIVVFVASMNLLNPDAFIAQKNLERFNATGKIDYEYLAGLSSDATPVLLTLFEKGDSAARSPLGRALYDRSIVNPEVWQSWNLPRSKEKRLLHGLEAEFAAYKDYQMPILISETSE